MKKQQLKRTICRSINQSTEAWITNDKNTVAYGTKLSTENMNTFVATMLLNALPEIPSIPKLQIKITGSHIKKEVKLTKNVDRPNFSHPVYR